MDEGARVDVISIDSRRSKESVVVAVSEGLLMLKFPSEMVGKDEGARVDLTSTVCRPTSVEGDGSATSDGLTSTTPSTGLTDNVKVLLEVSVCNVSKLTKLSVMVEGKEELEDEPVELKETIPVRTSRITVRFHVSVGQLGRRASKKI